jgi:ABC-type arginine/histidine transport system permease subunit
VRSLYFGIFSASFLITFLSPEIATSINIHVLFSLSRIIISGLLLGMVCQFELVDSTVWLRCLPGLFILILRHVRTSIFVQLYYYYYYYYDARTHED